MTPTREISIVGLPGSGKTTFLAALWHLIREDAGVKTGLRFGKLSEGNYEHLNSIAKLWRAGKIQIRTQTNGLKTVSMELVDENDVCVRVTFPDAPGEEYSRIWEDRKIDENIAATFTAPSILLLVNGDRIQFPAWVVERTALNNTLGLKTDNKEPTDWQAKDAPTQVQLVDLVQQMMRPPLAAGPRRLAVLISAWDRVMGEESSPENLLVTKLPLLNQYLRSGRDSWTWRVWGVSAQGGEYDDPEKKDKTEDAARLRALNRPSDRIMLVNGSNKSSDLTEPLQWLMK